MVISDSFSELAFYFTVCMLGLGWALLELSELHLKFCRFTSIIL